MFLLGGRKFFAETTFSPDFSSSALRASSLKLKMISLFMISLHKVTLNLKTISLPQEALMHHSPAFMVLFMIPLQSMGTTIWI